MLEERGYFVCFGPGLFTWLGQRRGCCGSAQARFNGLFRNLRVGEGGALVAGGASGRDAAQRLLVERHGDTASRLLHLMHGLIYRQRRVLLVAFLVLFGLLVPPALAILSNRVGGDLSIFGASVEMFAVDLIWENRTAVFSGVGGLAQLEARPLVPGWPSLYRRLARGSLSYRVPSLEFALWPSGTVLLSSVLFVDALLLLLSTGWPSALLRYLRRGIKGLRASSVSLEQQSPDGWAGVICACGRVQRSLFGLFSSGLLAGLGALGLVLQSNERWAILLLGCHYPVALNAVLAVLFLAHALFFAGLGSIFLTRYFDRVVSQRWLFGEADPDEANPEASRRRRRTRRGCVFLVLAALMITAMALVINYMEPENEGRPAISDGSDGSDAEGDGSDGGGGGGPPWKPHWEGICLATLCLFWSVVVMMAAAASVRNAPFGPFLPSCATNESRRTKMSFVMVCTFALVHAGGWTLLALSGYDLIWPRHAQLALGIGLLLSAALPAVYVCVLERKKPLCLLRPVPCSRAVALVTCVTLTLASSLAGVVLIAIVADAFNKPELPATSSITGGRGTGRGENSTSPHDGSGIDVPAWSPPWQAIGVCGVLLLWATIPLLAGFVTLRGQRLGHLLPIEAKARLRVVPGPSSRPRAAEESNSVARKYGQLLVVLGTALLVLAFVLLVLSGFGAFLGSGEDLRNLLGACVLVTSLVPAMLACVVGYDTTACGGLVASTDFTRRNRWTMTFAYVDLMLLCQLVSVAVFRANAEFFAWWLGVIWIINAAVSFMAARVVSTRVPVGFLRPLDPPQVLGGGGGVITGVRLQRVGLTPREAASLLLFSMLGALLLLFGIASLLLAYIWTGHDAVFGGDASVAIALGITLLIDAFLCLAVGIVFFRRTALFVFQPTEWARKSRVPAMLCFGLAALCLLIGSRYLSDHLPEIRPSAGDITGDTPPRASPPPPPPPPPGALARLSFGRADALAGCLACLGWAEAIVLLLAAYVQALGRRWACFRPLVSHDLYPYAASALVLGSAAVALAGTLAAYVAADMKRWSYLWGVRVLPLVGEVTMAAHAAMLAVMLRQIGRAWRKHRAGAIADGGGPSILGIFTLGRSFLVPFALAFVSLLGCLATVAVLPWQWRELFHASGQASGIEPGLELLGGLQAAAALYFLFSHGHTYNEDLTHAQTQLHAAKAKPQGATLASVEHRDDKTTLVWRRLLLAFSTLLALGSGGCYTLALGPKGLVEVDSERPYLTCLFIALALLVHLPILAIHADVFSSGVAAGGFAPLERIIEPNGRVRSFPSRRAGGALAVLTCAAAFATGVLLVVAMVTIEVRPSAVSGAASSGVRTGGMADQVPLIDADKCSIVFGLDPTPRTTGAVPSELSWLDGQGQRRWARAYAGFDPGRYSWQQEELRLLCDELKGSSAHPVVHAAWDNRGGCLMNRVYQYATRTGAYVNRTGVSYGWPLPEDDFLEVLLLVLAGWPSLRGSVGFHADGTTGYPTRVGGLPTRIAWMKEQVRSKYPKGGQLINDVARLDRYESEWISWFASLPTLLEGRAQWNGNVSHAPAGRSAFDDGFVTCSQFAIGPTVRAFLDGVTRALVYTPLFCLVAMLLFLGDVYLCYVALYTIVAIIVFVLGLLGVLGMSLGPIESLSFAIVIGISVDYLVHFAYAFKHSLMPEQYYKSRAVLLARSSSTFASGVTTLAAVVPLIWAQVRPLRIFGVIFSVVALVSLCCAFFLFNAILMATGPGIRMTIHSLPSGSALATLTHSTSTQSAADDRKDGIEMAARARNGESTAPNGEIAAPGGESTASSGEITIFTEELGKAFKGFSAKGVLGSIKV